MGALPILEALHKPWTSKVSGNMHACGHYGQTAMLHAVTIKNSEETKLAVRAHTGPEPIDENIRPRIGSGDFHLHTSGKAGCVYLSWQGSHCGLASSNT